MPLSSAEDFKQTRGDRTTPMKDRSGDQDAVQNAWIAIEPPTLTSQGQIPGRNPPPPPIERPDASTSDAHAPPSFTDSQFGIILRRQRQRPADNSGLKRSPAYPSRFIHLSNTFEFAGWGSMARVKLTPEAVDAGAARLEALRSGRVLGQFTASALAGNAVLGSVFYALPAVVAAGGVYSPISLFIATMVLFLWRPIMEELASALPISGGPYTYILNVSTKTFALVAAALLLLDFGSTSIVSAATAATYISGEVPALPFPTWVAAILILVLFTIISLAGVRESARLALAVLSLHLLSMLMLIVASCVHWGKSGNAQLRDNWHNHDARSADGTGTGTGTVARQIFFGVCLGMLGLTGFECTPSYISRIKPGRFPSVLRNLHLPAIVLNTAIMLLVLAVIPLDVVLSGANVLSVLAHNSGGHWLRIWIVVDAVIVLCGGVLTGILSACELLDQLALHRVIPRLFLRVTPRTGSPYIAVLAFVAFSGGMLYASARADLAVVSAVFSLVWLCVMSLFPLSLLMMRFSRGRMLRAGGGGDNKGRDGDRDRDKQDKGKGEEDKGKDRDRAGLGTIGAAVCVSVVVFAGNVAYNPRTAGYFSAYFIGLVACFSATQNKVQFLRWIYWVYDQYPALHRWRMTRAWDGALVAYMRELQRNPVCILAKTDEINSLFHMILYVQRNEQTSYLKIVHFYEEEKGVPSELEANAKILDEAFPEITVDLILVESPFDPLHVAALSHQVSIPQSLMFMSCPGPAFPHAVADLGARVISL